VLTIFEHDILKAFDHNAKGYDGEDIIYRIEVIIVIQSTLVCIEMLLLSYAGSLAYSHK